MRNCSKKIELLEGTLEQLKFFDVICKKALAVIFVHLLQKQCLIFYI